MIRVAAAACLITGLLLFESPAQESAPTKLAAAKTERKKEAKEKGAQSSPAGLTTPTDQPVTTEVYAEKAFFDSAKNTGVFTGHVVVNDPRFNIQSDKLTVYISKDENGGLEKAVADGNVGVVRDRPDPKGGPPLRSVGRSENAVYTTKDGNVELTGNPRVQQGLNMHVATSAETVMVLNENGQLTTHGPSRTEIRQQPKEEKPKP